MFYVKFCKTKHSLVHLELKGETKNFGQHKDNEDDVGIVMVTVTKAKMLSISHLAAGERDYFASTVVKWKIFFFFCPYFWRRAPPTRL